MLRQIFVRPASSPRGTAEELGEMTAAFDQADASDMRALHEALGL
ncbi:hypothetical protein [Kribbella sp. NPDC003557]